MKQVTDTGSIQGYVDAVLAANAQSVADYKAGKQAALGFLVGQIMKMSKGSANPAAVNELLKKALG